MLSANCLVKISGIQTQAQGPITFLYNDETVKQRSGSLHFLNNIFLLKLLEFFFQLLKQTIRHSPWWVNNRFNCIIQFDVITAFIQPSPVKTSGNSSKIFSFVSWAWATLSTLLTRFIFGKLEVPKSVVSQQRRQKMAGFLSFHELHSVSSVFFRSNLEVSIR